MSETVVSFATIATMLAEHGSLFMRRLPSGSRQLCVQIGGRLYRSDPWHGLQFVRDTVRAGRITKGKYPVWIVVSAQARSFLQKIGPHLFGAETPKRIALRKRIDDILWLDAQFNKPRKARNTYDG